MKNRKLTRRSVLTDRELWVATRCESRMTEIGADNLRPLARRRVREKIEAQLERAYDQLTGHSDVDSKRYGHRQSEWQRLMT